ncbi:hypothetical protein ERE_24160 [Agathobacter rectalis M104/1]|nr:hypothetical protein ERE_24160 [Agathobacter rectalis M104/1]
MLGANKKKKFRNLLLRILLAMPSQKAELQLSYRHS